MSGATENFIKVQFNKIDFSRLVLLKPHDVSVPIEPTPGVATTGAPAKASVGSAMTVMYNIGSPEAPVLKTLFLEVFGEMEMKDGKSVPSPYWLAYDGIKWQESLDKKGGKFQACICSKYDRTGTGDKWSRIQDGLTKFFRQFDQWCMREISAHGVEWGLKNTMVKNIAGTDDNGTEGTYRRTVQWGNDKVSAKAAEVDYYLNDKFGPNIYMQVQHDRNPTTKTLDIRVREQGGTVDLPHTEQDIIAQNGFKKRPIFYMRIQIKDIFISKTLSPRLILNQLQINARGLYKPTDFGNEAVSGITETAMTSEYGGDDYGGGSTGGFSGGSAGGGGGSIDPVFPVSTNPFPTFTPGATSVLPAVGGFVPGGFTPGAPISGGFAPGGFVPGGVQLPGIGGLSLGGPK